MKLGSRPLRRLIYLTALALALILVVVAASTMATVEEARGATPAQVCVPPPSGLVSWWPGDGNAQDIQDGNHGVLLNGVGFVPGKVGQAFSFDGVDDRVEVPDAANLRGMSQLTVDAWIYPIGLVPGKNQGIVTKWGPGGSIDDSYFLVWHEATGKLWGAVQGSSRVDLFGTQTLPLNEWSHVAMVYDAGALKLYVNGALDAAAPATLGAISNAIFPLYIGRNDFDTQSPGTFLGHIDEVEVVNRALSAAEIQGIFNAGWAGKCTTAPPTPTPTLVPGVSTLGMLALAMLLMTAFLWARRRRRGQTET